MRFRALALAAAAAAVLAGCTPVRPPNPAADTVTVAVSQPFTSVNPSASSGLTSTGGDSSTGGSSTDGDIAALTRTGFAYYDDGYRLVRDESFGTARILSRKPFTVRYTVRRGVTWSDGVPVDARDLLLSWAADSGLLDPARADAGLRSSTRVPTLRDGGRSLDVTSTAPFPDWPLALEPTLPAHVAGTALGGAAESGPAARKAAVATAIREGGAPRADLARWWAGAGSLAGIASDRAVLTATGPYRVSAIADGSVTVTANPRYRGARTPTYRRIVLKTVPDPLEQAAQLRAGAVDIATPDPTADAVKALLDITDARTTVGAQGLFENLALRVTDSASGAFADPRVRRAFLHVVPRAQLVRRLVAPVFADARPLQSFTLPPGDDDYARAADGNGSAAYERVDVAAARGLLAEAGAASPRVCILYDAADARRREEFALIQQSAAQAGFQVADCSSPDWTSRLGVPGAYDAVLSAWDTTQLGSAAIGGLYRSGSTAPGATGYANTEVDALVDRLASTDLRTQRGILAKIDELLWADAYGMPLFQYPAVSAVGRGVRNVSLSPLARGVFWNAWQWAPAPRTR
ncbi:MAG: hypothetical protein HY996_08080 [Micrococcales bacterium]|nr:hypothetical protein [Micrococcales bacterium]